MLAQIGEHLEAVAVATIGGAALVAASWVASHHGARRGARKGAEEGMGPVVEAMDTGNQKKIGHTVHDTAQTVEIVQAQAHANASDVLDLGERLGGIDEKVDRLHDKVDRIDGRVDRVDTKLDRHLTEVGEGSGALAAWVRRKMTEEEG